MNSILAVKYTIVCVCVASCFRSYVADDRAAGTSAHTVVAASAFSYGRHACTTNDLDPCTNEFGAALIPSSRYCKIPAVTETPPRLTYVWLAAGDLSAILFDMTELTHLLTYEDSYALRRALEAMGVSTRNPYFRVAIRRGSSVP